jgi:hypothetical protein
MSPPAPAPAARRVPERDARTGKKPMRNRRDSKTTLTCENTQEPHGFIVAELSFVVHFNVPRFPTFTYGNYADTLAE